MLIIDCRSYGAAFANRAKGGGVECPGKSCPVIYSGLIKMLIVSIVVLTLKVSTVKVGKIVHAGLCAPKTITPVWFLGLE